MSPETIDLTYAAENYDDVDIRNIISKHVAGKISLEELIKEVYELGFASGKHYVYQMDYY